MNQVKKWPASDENATFVHPSEDPLVIMGQGIATYEMIHQIRTMYQNEELDVVVSSTTATTSSLCKANGNLSSLFSVESMPLLEYYSTSTCTVQFSIDSTLELNREDFYSSIVSNKRGSHLSKMPLHL